jgi:signal transduction histidine kinase
LEALRSRVETEKDHKPFLSDELVLVMPVHSAGPVIERIRVGGTEVKTEQKLKIPERNGHLLIKLNRDTVIGKLLPALDAKYFPDGAYKISIADNAGALQFQTAGGVTTVDASGDLLTLTPDNFIFFANKELAPKDFVRERKAVISQHVESHTFTRERTESNSNSSSVFTIELKNDGEKKRQSVMAGTASKDDGWKLNVQHQAGSIAAFVSGEQNKRLLFGVGVYLLVIGAILAIVISALRSQRYAQRQIDFVSSVSHEFRTPLAVIYSAGENLADGVTQDREQTTRYGQLIKAEGKKLSSMVEQILEFAGARSGKRSYKFAETDPLNVVGDALAECSSALEQNGFEVEQLLPETLPSINADADALTAALQNLIQNSVKYSNGTKWLRVSASNGNGKVKFTVEDRGIGISQSDIGKIFEPFFRAKSVVDAQIHGNGLGLSLVKETAEAHGGKVSASSEIGKGSTFVIEIPQK